MSAAAQSAPAVRAVPNGFTKIPNSVISNIGILSHAELCLALVTLCKDSEGNVVTVDDATWVRWTGLQARMKKYAAAGLARRKCFRIDRSGKEVRFGWDHTAWRNYVREVSPAESRPRTLGRKVGVPPKPGAKVHPDCFERGCSKLADQTGGLSLVPCSTLQPVAPSVPLWPIPPASSSSGSSQKNKQVKSGTLQPVAPSQGSAETLWAKTLQEIQAAFPIAGVVFLIRLLAVIGAMFEHVTDEELANAVKVAYFAKKSKQREEGLFLLTVPDALAALRKSKPVPASVAVTDGLSVSVARLAEKLRTRGAPFQRSIDAVQDLAIRVNDADGWGNHETLYAEINRVEAVIVADAEAHLNAEQLLRVDAVVAEKLPALLPPYLRESGRQGDPRYREAVSALRSREILAVSGLPRVDDF